MEAIEAILGRRSIRKYLNKPIPEDVIETILRAAMSAPSANNTQPWYFIIIDEHEILEAITEFHPFSEMLKQAPLAVLVCGDAKSASRPDYLSLDCSAATENLLIAAHALGLGAVWLGIYPRKKRIAGMKQLMSLPDNIEPMSLISIGYPAEAKKPSNRYSEAKIRRNKWK